MASLQPFEQRLAAAWPPSIWRDVGVAVAVSGGADSVALLLALRAVRVEGAGRLTVAHFNHGLRGAESEADAEFVATLCSHLGVDCQIGRPATPLAGGSPDGVEAAARAARYHFLERTAERLGARYVVTAHTADDQAETILHHVMRGTGLRGLAGIHAVRPLGPAVTLVRPMLKLGRDEVLDYLGALGQPYREDRTNRDVRFTRNRIRHELLPLLKRDYAPGIVESLSRLGSLAADAGQVIDKLADNLLERTLIESNADQVTLDCRRLASEDRHLVRELFAALWRRQAWPLRAMGYAEWNVLADLALAETTPGDTIARKQILPGAISAERRAERLVLALREKSRQGAST